MGELAADDMQTGAGAEREDRFIIVTGGPGSGKTTLIEALGRRGLQRMPEAGRAIIREQVAIGGKALPWADRAAFAELMLGWELRSYREAQALQGPVIFDRGVPDVLGYLRLCGLDVPAHAETAARLYRYNTKVLIAPPWPAIFTQDTERKQSLAEAEATYRALAETYEALGYELVPLPLVPVEQRVDFVMQLIAG